MKENIGLKKSEDFGVKILKIYEILKDNKVPNPVIMQIVKSGTSIGANLFEANCAISDKDFLAKVYISLKECNETKYWLRLLYKSNYLTEALFNSFYSDADELYRILTATTITLRERINKK